MFTVAQAPYAHRRIHRRNSLNLTDGPLDKVVGYLLVTQAAHGLHIIGFSEIAHAPDDLP